MGEIFFYHLTRQPVEQALPQLLQRARDAGWLTGVLNFQCKEDISREISTNVCVHYRHAHIW